jgi:DNA-binding NarL/FixJ family response regulator
MASPVRLALVEDHAELRRHLAARLAFFDRVTLVAEAATAEAMLRLLAEAPPETHPEVVLMDIGLPGQSGIEATAVIRRDHPHVEVLMLTVFEDTEHLLQAIRAGASGYLLKDASTDEIVDAACELTQGGAPLTGVMARRILQHVRQTTALGPDAPASGGAPDAFGLSTREFEVLGRLVADATYDEIAEALFISPHTVRSHVKSIFRKLHVSNRAAAVREALQHRLV